ncbi:thioesterase II family protein [Streptomyces sp. KL116D]|uniref:thioesterase II family protein n=1 Tax=Streptomyces sp. KL116D TaxID=3045152 RepID=UPI003557125B
MTRYASHTSPTDGAETEVRLLLSRTRAAGASAYRRWQHDLDAHGAGAVLPVQLPGREGRMTETTATDLHALVAELDEQLDAELEHPHVFYGHSMGALVAYALTAGGSSVMHRCPWRWPEFVPGAAPSGAEDRRPGGERRGLSWRLAALGGIPG